ncbi:MAG: transposase [Chloroflexota bacterium]
MLIDRIPTPSVVKRRGYPRVYSDRLFLKALVIMIIRHLPKVHSLLAILDEPTPEMRQLHTLLTEDGRYPSRRTWERRLAAIPGILPAQIACLGHPAYGGLLLLGPWRNCGRTAAIDSTPLRALGGVWHRKHRDAGVVPHSSIDTEGHWTKSGWHGWVYGWKLHLVNTVASAWIPLAAELTAANTADNEQAFSLLGMLPAQVRFILGDTAYDDGGCGKPVRGRAASWSRAGAVPTPILTS